MDLGSLFLILALLIFVIWFVGRPFFERRHGSAKSVSPQDQTFSSLLAERDRVLNALQELDFDFTLGKVPEEDYPAQRAALLQRGAEALRKIDALTPPPSRPSPHAVGEGGESSGEDRIEAAIAARRVRPASSVPSSQPGEAGQGGAGSDEALESLIAARRRARPEKSAGFCPKCGKPIMKSDRFCPKCGNTLA
jgi:hypothetical protein